MLAVIFFIQALSGYSLPGFVPESLALLASSVCLIGATVVLRRCLKRRDEKPAGKIGKVN